jgi:hypothetical protein
MGYYHHAIIGKVMPKTIEDRTNTERIAKWFENEKDDAVEHMIKLELERKQDLERKSLIASLNLTPEQIALLGLAKTND